LKKKLKLFFIILCFFKKKRYIWRD